MSDNVMGFSYQPSAGTGSPDRTATNPQTAVRLLNLRVPRVVGPNAPIPGQLLNAPGGGPSDLNTLLKALMASFGGGTGRTPQKQIVGPGAPAFDNGINLTGPVRPPQIGRIAQPSEAPRFRPADYERGSGIPQEPSPNTDFGPIGSGLDIANLGPLF